MGEVTYMEYTTQDYLKKALLDTQERVRDYMYYAEQAKDPKVGAFLKAHAEVEGRHATALRNIISGETERGGQRRDR
jgi:rubrerythrin